MISILMFYCLLNMNQVALNNIPDMVKGGIYKENTDIYQFQVTPGLLLLTMLVLLLYFSTFDMLKIFIHSA